MTAPTLERVYELAPGLILEASRTHRLPPEFFEDHFQDWAVAYHDGRIVVRDDDHCTALLRQRFRDRARNSRRRPANVELVDHDQPTDPWEDLFEDEPSGDLISDFLADLSGIEQATFRLVHSDGLTYRQAAVRLGITRSEVTTALRRAGLLLERTVILYEHGRWCAKRSLHLQAADAVGKAAGDAALSAARAHLSHCTTCQREYRRLHERFTAGALGLIPAPLVLEAGPLERMHAALQTLRASLGAARARASDAIHNVLPQVSGSADTAERAFATGKAALAAICIGGATAAGVCTIAGVPLPGSARSHPPTLQKAGGRHPAVARSAVASTPTPPPRRTNSTQQRTHPKTTGAVGPAPAAPGATEFGPDSGGTNAPPPPAPASHQAAEVGP